MPLRPAASLFFFLSLCPPCGGFAIRDYDPALHQRFSTLPPNPIPNATGLYAAYDLSGIGWRPSNPEIQMTLITRQHALFASHFQNVISTMAYLGTGNIVHTRTTASKVPVQQAGQPSDLLLITLSSPLPASTGIKPLPYLDLANYTGVQIGISGFREETPLKFGVIGRDTITAVSPTALPGAPGSGLEAFTTRNFTFTYPGVGPGTPHEGYFQVGDSGNPSFGISNTGQAAIVGVHSFVSSSGGPNPTFTNSDVFVPHYVTEINAAVASGGYRFTPANAPGTTTSISAIATTPVPRQGHPLSASITLTNTGANLTGNLEIEISPSPAATSITAPAWVAYDSGLTQRKSTLNPGNSAGIDLHWSSTPLNATSISVPYIWRSDKAASGSATLTIPLAPSYAAWAQGLSMTGQADDPDADGLKNLLEYALGANPQSADNSLAPGVHALPVALADATHFEIRFPVRTDAALRALTYQLEFSPDLDSWSTTPPAGLVVTDSPYVPAISGIDRRSARWPLSSPLRFVRLRILLAE